MELWKQADVWTWIQGKPYGKDIDKAPFELVDGEQLLRISLDNILQCVKNEKAAKQLWVDIEEIRRIDAVRKAAFKKAEVEEQKIQHIVKNEEEIENLKSKIWFKPSFSRIQAEVNKKKFFLILKKKRLY